MYGTLGRMKPKAGMRDELIRMMSAPPDGAAANGYRGSYLLKADEDDELVVAVMYEDIISMPCQREPQSTPESAATRKARLPG